MALDRSKDYLPGFPESVQQLHGSEECVSVLLEVMRDYIQTEWFHINDLPKSVSRAFYRRMNKVPETGRFRRPRVSPTPEVKRPFSGKAQTISARRPVSNGNYMNKLRANAGAPTEVVRQQSKGYNQVTDKDLKARFGIQSRVKGLKFHLDVQASTPTGTLHELIEDSSELSIDTSATKEPKDIQSNVEVAGSKSVDYFTVENYVHSDSCEYQLRGFACPFKDALASNFHSFRNEIAKLNTENAHVGLDLYVKREVSNSKYVLDILFVENGANKYIQGVNKCEFVFSRLNW